MATLEEIHEVELEMFRDFDKICTKLNIRYCMVAGTLLGAIRHQGFIPWDDDIDVYMSMKDAAKLEKRFHSSKYFLQTPRSDPEMPYIMYKIRKNGTRMTNEKVEGSLNIHKGVFLDIFLYTNAGRSRLSRKLQMKTMQALQSFRCRHYHAVTNPGKKLHVVLSKLPEKLCRVIDGALCGLIRALGSKRSGEIFALDVRDPYFFKKSYFDKTKRYQFEDSRFWGIEEYDDYLTGFYGPDYMTPKKWGHMEDYSQVVL